MSFKTFLRIGLVKKSAIMVAKDKIIRTTQVTKDSLDGLPISKPWITLVMTYQTNLKANVLPCTQHGTH